MTRADLIMVGFLLAVFTVILYFWGIGAALVFMVLGAFYLLVA